MIWYPDKKAKSKDIKDVAKQEANNTEVLHREENSSQ